MAKKVKRGRPFQSTWTEKELQRLRQTAADDNLRPEGVRQLMGVGPSKFNSGMVRLYRELLQSIQNMREEPVLVDADADTEEEERQQGVLPRDTTTSALEDGALPSPPTARPAAQPTEDGPTGRKEAEMAGEGSTEAQLARLDTQIGHIAEQVKDLTGKTGAAEEKLRQTERINETLGIINERLNSMQKTLEAQAEERKDFVQRLESTSKQVEEHNGRFQNLSLNPKQLQEAMVRCVQEGGEFCELLSADVQRRAMKDKAEGRAGHDHEGAEEFWECPTCSKALLDTLGSDGFDEVRQTMLRAVPEKDIPVLLERLQKAGMKVVKERESIFLG